MASSSKLTVSQVEANSLADEWEARVRCFIDDDDKAGFLKDQPVLFKNLVSLEVLDSHELLIVACTFVYRGL